MNIDPQLLEAAGECGYRSLVMMLGCWDGMPIATVPLPMRALRRWYGVCLVHEQGFSLAGFNDDEEITRKPGSILSRDRRTVEAVARGGAALCPRCGLAPGLPDQAAVFVTLEMQGHLRGCIGTIEPVHASLAEEVIANARQAAFGDPAFSR